MEKQMQPRAGFSLEARQYIENKNRTCREARRMQPQDVGFRLAEPCSEIVVRPPIFIIHPTNVRFDTRPFLRWVQSQGRSPHMTSKVKNTLGPVSIPLIRGAKQYTPKESKNLEGLPPSARGNLQCQGTLGRTVRR